MRSEAYQRAVAEAARHHQRSKTYSGKLLRPHADYLDGLIERLEVRSALDYGCGKGEQYSWRDPAAGGRTLEERWGFEVAKYDPAWPPFAQLPAGPFELVIVTHVLGSIPLSDLGAVLDEIHGLATKAVFIGEKIGPVKKSALSAAGGRPVGWTRDQWAKEIAKHTRPGIETILSTVQRGPTGKECVRARV